MDEATLEKMAKAYSEALKAKIAPKTSPFPGISAPSGKEEEQKIAILLKRELTAVEFLLQCAVKEEKKKLLGYLRILIYEVMRKYPLNSALTDTDRYLSPEMAKVRLAEFVIDRLHQTEQFPRNGELYAVNSRILALITLI